MSAIQTIRQKYSWLMLGLIILALVGFLAMDAFQNNSGSLFGGNDRSLGSINGTKISPEEYNKLETTYMDNARSKDPKMDDVKSAEVRSQVWDDLVNQKILESEYAKLGIEVSDKELQDILTGPYPDQMVQQNFTDPATGIFDGNRVKQFLTQLRTTKDTAQRKQWNNFEKGLIEQRQAQKYSTLISMASGFTPSGAIEAKYAERSSVASATFVKVPYTSIDDSKVAVTDEDINKYIAKYSNAFTLPEEMRKADYVAFDVIPTGEDTANSLGVLNNTAVEFANTTNMAEFLGKNSDEGLSNNYFKKGTASSPLVDSALKNAVGSVVGPIYEEGSFKLIKILDKKDIADSVKVSDILVKITQQVSDEDAEKRIDSFKKTIENGGNFAQLATSVSEDEGTKSKGGDMGYITRGEGDFYDSCFYGKTGQLKKIKTGNGWILIHIDDQKNFNSCSKVAVFSKALKASDNTLNAAFEKASSFANKSKDKTSFDKNVKEKGFTKRVAEQITASQTVVKGMGVAREVVRWMYNDKTKVGNCSDVLTVKDGYITKYIVANLSQVSPKGIAPAAMVREQLEGEIRRQKKATMIANNYKSLASLNDIASKAAVQVQTADTVLLAGTSNPVIGQEPKVIGACFNKANQNKVSQPIMGNDGVYFVNVKNINLSTAKPSAQDMQMERQMIQMQAGQNIGRSIPGILKKKAQIKDNRGNIF